MTTPQQRLQTLCQRYRAAILTQTEQRIEIAVEGQPDREFTDALRFCSSAQVDIICWNQAQMAAWQDKHASLLPPDTGVPAAGKLDQILALALQRRASDIHIEPQSEAYRVRLRIDGVLQVADQPTLTSGHAMVARLKVLAGLDIAERRLPQDGQFTHQTSSGQNASFRLSTLPTQHGEKSVLRLLQGSQQAPEIDNLGMSSRALQRFREALAQPQGLILVTGPTGSGKTITLYSGLNWLNQPQRNICSVEDPIEIPLSGIVQTQINSKAGIDFQLVLRALLRQDPDVIMLGEIRDAESASIAINAAQTGHLVLSTLHTNSTLETLTRLKQMGLPGYQLGPALKMIIAQRLVRKLCPHCRQPAEALGHLPPSIWPGTVQNWQACGCEQCYSGYYGRMALFEVLTVTPRLQNAIASDVSLEELSGIADEQGLSRLFVEGLQAVNRGDTTLEELMRVTGQRDG